MNEKIACFMLGFHRIFVFIRSQIQSEYNENIMKVVSKYSLRLESGSVNEFEKFKTEILKIVEVDIKAKDFLFSALNIDYKNYTTDNITEIYRYLPVLSNVASEICRLLRDACYDQAYDLVDSIHYLPDAILDKRKWNAKAFWRTYDRRYKEKWKNNFLENSKKKLVKKGILDIFRKHS